MFWRKKKEVSSAIEGAATAAIAATSPEEITAAAKTVVKTPKEKRLSPKDELTSRIEQLRADEEIIYSLSETFGGGLTIVKLNPEYPNKGKKFALYSETLVNGQPSGERSFMWDRNKPKDLTNWIMDRNGQPFGI